MRRLITMFVLASAMLLGGCLWVCRVPFPAELHYSDNGECTNRTWKSIIACLRDEGECNANGIYPLTKMRCHATSCSFSRIDTENLKGEALHEARMRNRWMWIPGILIWIGEPIDLAVDTILIPWDM